MLQPQETYTIAYAHEDGPLLGVVAACLADDGAKVTLHDLRTDAVFTVDVFQIEVACMVDGPHMSDDEVDAIDD